MFEGGCRAASLLGLLVAFGALSPVSEAVKKAPGRGDLPTGSNIILEVGEVSVCPKKQCSMTFVNVTSQFYEESGQILFRGVLDIERPAESWSQIKIVMHKCIGGVTANTCEYATTFTSRKNQNLCAEFLRPNLPWYSMMQKVHPPWKCPTKKGRYSVDNATLDCSILGKMVPTRNLNADTTWLTQTEWLDEKGQCFLCIKSTGRLLRSNRGSRKP